MSAAKKTVVYRTYFFPGSFFDEDSSGVVMSRDLIAAINKAPKGAFAFQFYSRSKTLADGEVLWGKERDRSPMYYLGGKAYTLDDVKREYPSERTLILNMEGNGYPRVIKTRCGNWKPLAEKDVVCDV